MDERMILVPCGIFIDAVKAQADLDSIRAIVETNSGYCSDDIRAVLGLEVKKITIPRKTKSEKDVDNAVSD